MTGKSIAVLTYGMYGGAFASVAAGLANVLQLTDPARLFLVYQRGRPGPDVRLPEGVTPVRLGVKRSMASPRALASFLRRERPDVLITLSGMVTLPAIIGWRLSGVSRETRLVVYQSDTLASEVEIDHATDPRLRLLPTLARRLFPLADGMVATNTGLVDLLEQQRIPIPQRRLAVIPNPVDVDLFRSRARAAATHPWLAAKTTPVLTSLGRLVERKNYTLLLRALAEVRKRRDVRLVVFGEGPARPKLESTVEDLGLRDAVSLPGHVANPWAEIARSDAFVMSSLDEAFCLALAEAMAVGVPVVATDAIGGGPTTILEGGRHGILVPNRDAASLAAALGSLLSSPEQRRDLARAASLRSEAFRPQSLAARWTAFLEEVLVDRAAQRLEAPKLEG